MKITLHTLEWDNWFTYGEGNVINFDNDVTQVVGDNGVGKTSIFIILEETLLGITHKNIRKSSLLNRFTKNPIRSVLSFSVGNTTYSISYKRTVKKLTLQFFDVTNNTDLSAHKNNDTYKAIYKVLGVSNDPQLLINFIYQSSKSGLDLLEGVDSKRLSFLKSLFGLESYNDIADRIKQKVQEYNNQLLEAKGQLKSTRAFVESISLEEKLEYLPAYNSSVESLSRTRRDLEEEASAALVREKIMKQQEKFQEEQVKLQKLQEALPEESRSELENRKSEIKEQISELEKEKQEIKQEYQELSLQIGIIRSKKTDISGLASGDTCPTCFQEIKEEFLQKIKESNQQIESEYNKLLEKQKAVSNKGKQKAKEIEAIQAQVSDIEALIYKIRAYNQQKEKVDSFQLEEGMNAASRSYSEIKAEKEQIEKQIAEEERLARETQEHNRQVELKNSEVENKVKLLKEQKKKLAELEANYNELHQEYKDWEFLKSCYSNKGIISYKLNAKVIELQKLINGYLNILSDGRFSLEFTIVEEKLKQTLFSYGEPADLTEFSSGETACINIAMLLSIRNALSNSYNTNINVLCLDEIMGLLDDNVREKLIDLLLEEKEVSVFMVSHGYTHPLLKKLYVKMNNTSYISDY